ncbi:MAG TPA: ParB/RepB/Spo0J family partition protein [Steroidobacteraceae bacterium]|nr:ParB/RepB/Spo0J family partition protein [Steroidobacteraceae bacterium]
MNQIVSVNPFRCRLWALHDRLEEHITEETCKAEIHSFLEYGQLVPALGRRVRDDDIDVELIYGARRLFAARHLNIPLLVEVRHVSDKEAIVAMDIENRQRKDISPYERGLNYVRWLRGGYFQSQEEIADALKVSASQVSRLVKVATLPSVVINAFSSAVELCEGWGLDLAKALQDPNRRSVTIAAARAIAALDPRPPAKDVYRKLMAASVRGRKATRGRHDKVVKDLNGAPLFRVRHQRNSIVLVLPVEKTGAKTLAAIERAVAEICAAPSSPISDSPALRSRCQSMGSDRSQAELHSAST